MPHCSFSNSKDFGVAELCCPAASSWTPNSMHTGGDHGRRMPSYCSTGVFEGKATWSSVIAMTHPQPYSLILGHRLFLHKGSGITSFPHLGGLIAVGKRSLSGSPILSCSQLLPRTTCCFCHGTTLFWSPHFRKTEVHVCLFLAGSECDPFISVHLSWASSMADFRTFNKWLDFITLS